MEDQELAVVKDNFFFRIMKSIKKLFVKDKKNELVEEVTNGVQEIINNNEFIQKEILDARKAYRKYVINNKDIATEILNYAQNKIEENQQEIRRLIDSNNDPISYEDIIKMVEKEIGNVSKYKHKNSKTGRYNVPIGVVGVECSNAKESINCMLKSISTRNAVIILHDNYNKYSTEALVLMILKECLKNFYVDDNLIQMFAKIEIDLTKLDSYVPKVFEGKRNNKENVIYLYQENDKFKQAVQDEINRLQNCESYKNYEIKPISGEFGEIVNFLNAKNSAAVCMYTDNSQKAYKFINWINSPNVFVNTGVQNCGYINSISDYYNAKYVLHEDVF